MSMNASVSGRYELLSGLFPEGVPRLWCPMLTHFATARSPDESRIRAHLESLSPYVQGILVPGSTGEGWEMTDENIRVLLDLVLDAAHTFKMHVLVGVLKTDVDAMLASIDAMQDLLRHPAVTGITICPPKGTGLSQSDIRDGLCRVLMLGWPTALYQLPQVTQNEMTPATVASLASEFQNFILFKDTSGCDKVATSGVDLSGVFMVRGAEQGGYASWPRAANGPYDGFLLSTANVFAKEIGLMMQLLDDGDAVSAQALSSKLVHVVEQTFTLVSSLPEGNAFANANKVLDHCMAYGEQAARNPPPLLYGGFRLPVGMIERGTSILGESDLLPKHGYCCKR